MPCAVPQGCPPLAPGSCASLHVARLRFSVITSQPQDLTECPQDKLTPNHSYTLRAGIKSLERLWACMQECQAPSDVSRPRLSPAGLELQIGNPPEERKELWKVQLLPLSLVKRSHQASSLVTEAREAVDLAPAWHI